jgi:hypothetical protein
VDRLQERLARIGLEVLGGRGFVLGGGHAVELHGMASRPSEDIDLFSPVRGSPGEAAADLIAAYRNGGFGVAVLRETADLVQIEVTGAGGEACKVDLGVFWRSRAPVLLEVGPVLHPDDAAGGKMDALFNRWAPRDYLDINSILASGRYTRRQLLDIAAGHNPGFSPQMFSESLSYLRDIPDREFAAYDASAELIIRMRRIFADWERELKASS